MIIATLIGLDVWLVTSEDGEDLDVQRSVLICFLAGLK